MMTTITMTMTINATAIPGLFGSERFKKPTDSLRNIVKSLRCLNHFRQLTGVVIVTRLIDEGNRFLICGFIVSMAQTCFCAPCQFQSAHDSGVVLKTGFNDEFFDVMHD